MRRQLRLRAQDLRLAGAQLRPRRRWLRRPARLRRHLRGPADLRRRRPARQVRRHQQLRAQDVRLARHGLRPRGRRLRQPPPVRQHLPRRRDLRRRRAARVCGPVDAGSTTCTGLCLQQVTCSGKGVTTTITGTVYAPNGTDPIYNALVYIPNAPVANFTPGVACDQCTSGRLRLAPGEHHQRAGRHLPAPERAGGDQHPGGDPARALAPQAHHPDRDGVHQQRAGRAVSSACPRTRSRATSPWWRW